MLRLNKTAHAGFVGGDPEIRYNDNGQCMAKFSLAVDESYRNKQGEKVEQTEWIRVVLWGKQAELAEKYIRKGSGIYLEGKMQTRSYDDKDGIKRYTTEVVGSFFQFTGPAPAKPSQENSDEQPPAQSFGGGFEDGPGDVPF